MNWYFENGKKLKIERYVNGIIEGWVKEYFEDGETVMKETLYVSGKMENSKEYDKEGNIIWLYGYD